VPVLAAIKWIRTYHAAVATPLEPGHPVRQAGVGRHSSPGHWRCLHDRHWFFGALQSWWCLTLPLIGALITLAFSAPLVAFAATAQSDGSFTAIYRFAFVPMFLFSATFFPVSSYPGYLRPIVQFMPLYHGVALARAAAFWRRILRCNYFPHRVPRGDGRCRHFLGPPHDASPVGRLMLTRTLPQFGSRRSRHIFERNSWSTAPVAHAGLRFLRAPFLPTEHRIGLNHLVGNLTVNRRVSVTPRSSRPGCSRRRR